MPAIDIARGVAFAAAALAVGTVAFAALVWLPALGRTSEGGALPRSGHTGHAFLERGGRLLLAASLCGLASAVVILALGDLPGTRRTIAWSAAAAGFAALLVVAARARGHEVAMRGAAGVIACAACAVLVLVPGISGNAAGEDPAAVLVTANAIHVLAASVWAGGIACLLYAVPAGVEAVATPPRRSALLVEVVAGFSAVALLAVVALALTGVIQGIVLVGRIDELVTTGYGRLVLIKGALLCALALAGAAQRSRTLPALRAAAAGGDEPGAADALRRLLTVEAALLAAVFAVTAVLAATPPAAGDDRTRSVQASGRLGAFDVLLTARPGRPGDNDLSIALSGAPGRGPATLQSSARQRRLGIGPSALRATRTGPRRYRIEGASLPAPGTWEITLVGAGAPPARLSLRLR